MATPKGTVRAREGFTRRSSRHLHDGIAGKALEQARACLLQVVPVLGFERDLHAVLRVREFRIGAEEQRGELGEERVQILGEAALADADENVAQVEGAVAE